MDDINKMMKILIVDDSLAMRRIVKKFFRSSKFENLIEAEDGLKALETVQNVKIDLIVCDLNMPQMNGLELLKILKNDTRTRHIPFVMLTVEAIQKTMNKAVALGVDSYIVKPVTQTVFINEMMRVIKNRTNKETLAPS